MDRDRAGTGQASPAHGVETAGRLAAAPFPAVAETQSVKDALERIAGNAFATSALLIVTDWSGRYRGRDRAVPADRGCGRDPGRGFDAGRVARRHPRA